MWLAAHLTLPLLLAAAPGGDTHEAPGAADGVVHVRDHGAVPDDGADDFDAIQRAIAALRDSGGHTLRFEPGRYDIAAPPEDATGRFVVQIDGVGPLTVDGQGAELRCDGLQRVFGFGRVEGLTLKNFTIDWNQPTYSMATVVATGERWFDARADEGYPITEAVKVDAINEIDRETRRLARQGLEAYWQVTETELVEPNVLRVHTKGPLALGEGDWVLLRHQVYAYNAVNLDGCSDVVIRDVTVHFTPGMGLYASACTNLLLDGFDVRLRPGTDRPMSATADGAHISGCHGKLEIRNCTFEAQGDDAVNAKGGLYLTVLERTGPAEVRAAHRLEIPFPPKPGEVMELTDPDTILPYGTATVAAVETEADGHTHRVTFEDPLPERVAVGQLLGNQSRIPDETHIHDNVMRGNRARGFLIQVRNALIEDNLFEDVSSGGVWMIAEVAHFNECVPARDVVLRNNRFINCAYGGPLGEAVVGTFTYVEGYKPSTRPGVFRDIRIADNLIDGCDNAAIVITASEDVAITGNRVVNACRKPTHGEVGASAVVIRSSRDVLLEGNSVLPDAQGEGCARTLLLGDGVDRDEVTLRRNEGL